MLNTRVFPSITVGINNRAHSHELPKGAVRDAVNVDLSKAGHPRRRNGTALALAGTAMRSIWTSTSGRCFYADGASLYEFMNGTGMLCFTGLNPTSEVCYEDWPGRGIVFSDGAVIKRIVGNKIYPVALSPCYPGITASASTGGSLPAGIYQVNVQFMDDLGEESGTVRDYQLDVPANGSIVVTVPQSIDATATKAAVYLSDPNGDLMFRAMVVPLTTSSVTISVLPSADREQHTSEYRVPLPAGDILKYFEGRLYSHSGGLVCYTDSFSGQMRPASNYLYFPEAVSIIHASPTGMYFVADKTYYRQGTDESSQLRPISPARGARGTLVKIPRTETAMWFGTNGMVLASEDGSVSPLQADNISTGSVTAGASIYREKDGLRSVLTSIFDYSDAAGADSSYTDDLTTNREDRDDSL